MADARMSPRLRRRNTYWHIFPRMPDVAAYYTAYTGGSGDWAALLILSYSQGKY